MNTYPKKIKEQIKNTRHMYSHYTKKNKTIKGDNFIYLYYILELSFRVLVLEDVSVKYGNEIEENLFSIHDWIMENRKKNIKLEEYKSATYKMTKKQKNKKYKIILFIRMNYSIKYLNMKNFAKIVKKANNIGKDLNYERIYL